MLVLNGKEVFHGVKGKDLPIRRGKDGSVIDADPDVANAREVLLPRAHKHAQGFSLKDRARFQQ